MGELCGLWSRTSGSGFREKVSSSRKQTAVGFRGWMRARDYDSFLKACGSRAIQRGLWPELGPGAIGGPDQAESVPGDRFFWSAAGTKPAASKG